VMFRWVIGLVIAGLIGLTTIGFARFESIEDDLAVVRKENSLLRKDIDEKLSKILVEIAKIQTKMDSM